MSLRKDGIVVVLSSPSGAGKTTLVKKIAQENNFKISISYTTRKSRTNEANGKDYFFISEEEFKSFVRRNAITRVQNISGYSEKKAIKNVDNQLTSEFLQKLYNEKKQTFANWDKAIESTFKSIKDYVSKSEDEDW